MIVPTDFEMDPRVRVALRRTLVDLAAGRVQTPWWRRVVPIATVVAVLAGVGGVAVATVPELLGADQVVARSALVESGERTGSASVPLGPRPDHATGASFSVRCTEGALTFPDGSRELCDAAGLAVSGVVTLAPGATSFNVSGTPGSRWSAQVRWVTSSVTDWGVNADGQSYGVQNGRGMPELVLVTATNGREGYVRAHELAAAEGPTFTSPADAVAWSSTPHPPVPVTVYEQDGRTVVGEFDVG